MSFYQQETMAFLQGSEKVYFLKGFALQEINSVRSVQEKKYVSSFKNWWYCVVYYSETKNCQKIVWMCPGLTGGRLRRVSGLEYRFC